MKVIKKCNCVLVGIVVLMLCILISYINGYAFGNWGATTWIVAIFIALTAGFCLMCRQKEDE